MKIAISALILALVAAVVWIVDLCKQVKRERERAEFWKGLFDDMTETWKRDSK